MNPLTVLGKYLDQPRLVKKFSNAVPAILTIAGAGYTIKDVYEAPKEQKSKVFLSDIIVLGGTIYSALKAPRFASKLVKRHEHEHAHHHHSEEEHIVEFLKSNPVSDKIKPILEKAKKKILSFSEVRTLFGELGQRPEGREFLDELVPNPENIDSKHIFGEIGWLSVMGLIPVLGGIASGTIADVLMDKNWRDKIPNKIKEGSYQYLANIFLCNVGAGAALFAMERANVTSKMPRAIGMITGIILAGVVFGSAAANLIGRKIIDPLMGHKHKDNCLYCERTPEILDVGLHVDDVATVAVLSGLKWIEPALPILYSISGYRAGIGYRNG